MSKLAREWALRATASLLALALATMPAVVWAEEADSTSSAAAEEASLVASDESTIVATATTGDISKYGNIGLSVSHEDLAAIFDYGDIVQVSFLDTKLYLPFCGAFSDVPAGSPGLFSVSGMQPGLAINKGDFATTYGIATKDEGGSWHYADGVEGPVTFSFSLYEKGGGDIPEPLVYTNERSDYPQLGDEEFANFRAVSTTGMGAGVLYRSSSPVNPNHGRNAYADAATRKAGITHVMNLADSEAVVTSYPGYAETYYAGCAHVALDMDMDFSSERTRAALAEGLRFFAQHPGTYLIHCSEGTDRAGFVAAMLECLMGASYDEMVSDYMLSYHNYYGIESGDARYGRILQNSFLTPLAKELGVEDLAAADLAAEAEEYLLGLGLTDDEVAALRRNLGGIPATHIVSFDMGGHGTAPEAQTVEDGAKATQPEDPTAEGYSFGGWFMDDERTGAYDFDAPVVADLTLYAKWDEVEPAPTPEPSGKKGESTPKVTGSQPTTTVRTLPQTGDDHGCAVVATLAGMALLAGAMARSRCGAR